MFAQHYIFANIILDISEPPIESPQLVGSKLLWWRQQGFLPMATKLNWFWEALCVAERAAQPVLQSWLDILLFKAADHTSSIILFQIQNGMIAACWIGPVWLEV